jgi:hypothetical protein
MNAPRDYAAEGSCISASLKKLAAPSGAAFFDSSEIEGIDYPIG